MKQAVRPSGRSPEMRAERQTERRREGGRSTAEAPSLPASATAWGAGDAIATLGNQRELRQLEEPEPSHANSHPDFSSAAPVQRVELENAPEIMKELARDAAISIPSAEGESELQKAIEANRKARGAVETLDRLPGLNRAKILEVLETTMVLDDQDFDPEDYEDDSAEDLRDELIGYSYPKRLQALKKLGYAEALGLTEVSSVGLMGLVAKDIEQRQALLAATQKLYKIGFSQDVTEYVATPDFAPAEAETNPGQVPRFGPLAFPKAEHDALQPLRLALTLAHENLHRQQFRRTGDMGVGRLIRNQPKVPRDIEQLVAESAEYERAFQEAMAYQSELDNMGRFRPQRELTEKEAGILEQFRVEAEGNRDQELGKLPKDLREAFLRGDYVAVIQAIRAKVPEAAMNWQPSEQLAGKTRWP